MDFTLSVYRKLLESILNSGYDFQTFEEFIQNPNIKVIILRHDIDERPENALKMAQLEHGLGITATYYFRIVKISNQPNIIKKIVSLGHEIGYHYEDLSLCSGDIEKAIFTFNQNLQYFRKFYPVSTVCMHGSSFSGIDNREIWKYKSLEDFKLLGEPYLSIDFSKVFYVTDTARRWDAGKYSIRDKVNNSHNLSFHKTSDIIRAIQTNNFPNQAIIQSHTLWTDNILEWLWLEFRERLRNPLKVIFKNIPIMKKAMFILTKRVSN